MKKQINDLLLKMQNGENCIGETANELLNLYNVSLSLLGVAKCPNSSCNNNGTIAYQTANGDWEPEPCEWCHRKNELLDNEG
jgi:hypothetical protein